MQYTHIYISTNKHFLCFWQKEYPSWHTYFRVLLAFIYLQYKSLQCRYRVKITVKNMMSDHQDHPQENTFLIGHELCFSCHLTNSPAKIQSWGCCFCLCFRNNHICGTVCQLRKRTFKWPELGHLQKPRLWTLSSLWTFLPFHIHTNAQCTVYEWRVDWIVIGREERWCSASCSI